MKKVTLVLALCALALATPLSALAGKSPANKVNGDLWFTNTSGPAHWVFNAQDLATGDKGSVTYQDADGIYTADVTDAVVKDGEATFTAEVTSSTIGYAYAGDTFTWTVKDNGEGSTGTVDTFTFDHAVLAILGHQPYTPNPIPSFDITSGNIQVHFNG